MSNIGSIYKYSKVTPLPSPHHDTQENICQTKNRCCNHLRNHLWCTLDVPTTIDFLSLRFRIISPSEHRFWFCITHASTDLSIFRLPQNLPKISTLGYLSSILTTPPQFVASYFLSKSLAKILYVLLWLCALDFIWTPRVTCVNITSLWFVVPLCK